MKMKFELIFHKFLIYKDLWKEKQTKKTQVLNSNPLLNLNFLLSKYYTNSINPNIMSQSMK